METPSFKSVYGKLRGNWIGSGSLLFALTGIVLRYGNGTAAEGNPAQSQQVAADRQVIAEYLGTERAQFSDLQNMLRKTDGLLGRCVADPSQAQIPLAKLRSNPFAPGALARGPNGDAAGQQKSDADRVAMLHDLQKLQLQSIVTSGDHPQCMIDSRFYQEGDQIDTFTVERIGDGVVVVRNGGYRFELRVGG